MFLADKTDLSIARGMNLLASRRRAINEALAAAAFMSSPRRRGSSNPSNAAEYWVPAFVGTTWFDSMRTEPAPVSRPEIVPIGNIGREGGGIPAQRRQGRPPAQRRSCEEGVTPPLRDPPDASLGATPDKKLPHR
jgi:hypothetical protein